MNKTNTIKCIFFKFNKIKQKNRCIVLSVQQISIFLNIDIFAALAIGLPIVRRQTITVKNAFVYHDNGITNSTTFNDFGQTKNKQILQTTES